MSVTTPAIDVTDIDGFGEFGDNALTLYEDCSQKNY